MLTMSFRKSLKRRLRVGTLKLELIGECGLSNEDFVKMLSEVSHLMKASDRGF